MPFREKNSAAQSHQTGMFQSDDGQRPHLFSVFPPSQPVGAVKLISRVKNEVGSYSVLVKRFYIGFQLRQECVVTIFMPWEQHVSEKWFIISFINLPGDIAEEIIFLGITFPFDSAKRNKLKHTDSLTYLNMNYLKNSRPRTCSPTRIIHAWRLTGRDKCYCNKVRRN